MKNQIFNAPSLTLFTLTLLGSSIAVASPASEMDAMKKAVQTRAQNLAGQVLHWDLLSRSGFSIHCPVGLKCPSKDYSLMLKATSSKAYLMASFDLYSLTGLNTDLLRSKLSYMTFSLDLSSLVKSRTFKVSTTDQDTLVRRNSPRPATWEITKLQNGILGGRVSTRLTTLEVKRVDSWAKKNCPEIADGPTSENCTSYVEVNLPVQINFSLPVPTQVKDCTKAGISTPGCG